MSDVTLDYRSAQFLAPAKTSPAPATAPLGVWTILGWGMAANLAILATWLVDLTLKAVWGVRLPLMFDLLPLGHIAAAAIVVIALRRHGRAIREYLAISPIGWGDVARGIGYGVLGYVVLAMMFILIMLAQLALGIESSTAPTIAKAPFNMQTMIWLASLWLGMVVAAPIVEEMLFRGLLYRGLAESRIGVVGAMLVTSIVFGLGHYPGFGWTRVIATGVAGMFFVWLRWYYGNTSIGMVAHAVTNTIAASILTAIILS